MMDQTTDTHLPLPLRSSSIKAVQNFVSAFSQAKKDNNNMDEPKIEMITEADIQPLELKHKKVYDFLKYILGNPMLDTYLSTRKQLDKWNKEVFDNPEKLSDNKDEKRFERVMAFLIKNTEITANLEHMKSKLLPAELEKTKKNYASLADEVRERSNGKG